MAILIADKVDFRIRNVNRSKRGHFIINVGSVHLKDVIIQNVCAPNMYTNTFWTLKYMNQILLKLKRERESKITAERCQKLSCNNIEQLDKKSIGYRKHEQHYQLTWPNWYL